MLYQFSNLIPDGIKLSLLKIAKMFVHSIEIPNFRVLDVVLTGSMANFNYTKHSDFDVHVVTSYKDLQCDDLADAFYNAKKKLWNEAHDITVKGHEVEMYVEDVNDPPISAGVYSLLKGQWLKTPEYNKPTLDTNAINAKARDLVKQIDAAISTANDPMDLKRLANKLRNMRQSGLESGGEFSVENLAYKILRNTGNIDRLYKAFLHQQDLDLSLVVVKNQKQFQHIH
jgi:predicted nucleotidyltransferase